MPEGPQETLVERTLTNLASAWRDIAQSAARTVGLAKAPAEASPESLERLMRDCLEARGGEVSARMRAAALGRIYLEQDAEGRQRFLTVLAREFSRSEEHTSELQSLMRISYAVFCLKKKTIRNTVTSN